MKVGLLVSGDLGKIVLDSLFEKFKVKFVLTDKKSTKIIEFCQNKLVLCYCGNPRSGEAFEIIKKIKIDLIVSANYLFLIEKNIINLPKIFSINFHGSLLPKYRGRTPHVWAVINNEKKAGITAHVIDEGCDTGEIINQIVIPILHDDTGNDLLDKYKDFYPTFIFSTIEKIRKKTFHLVEQNEERATVFSKRTPEDGGIDWNWQKERIRNWVRALSKPYPGAFSYINKKKIVIHKVEFSNFGYDGETENGTVIEIVDNYPIIKTSNGSLKIVDFNYEYKIEINELLN